MKNRDIAMAFSELSTPLVCDASLGIGSPARVTPAGIHPLIPGLRQAGRARPARH